MSKKQKSKISIPGTDSGCVCVRLHNPGATRVCAAGSFNEWNPSATPLVSLGDGDWGKELVLPPGRYEYRFVVDGQWIDDPAAKQTVPNPFGGVNAVFDIPPAGSAV